MGHDLGHTPFGHVGEDILDELYSKGFKHNEQSLRVVGILEKNGQGLNLTREVRDGIVNHSKMRANIMGKDSTRANTMEGQVCQISDAIAYINHDIGDAIRAGIITEHSLPLGPINALGYSHSHRINTMVCDVIETSLPTNGYNKPDTPIIGMSQPVLGATNQLRDFLFEQVYNLRSTLKESEKAKEVVRLLYQYFKQHEDQMPAEYRFYDSDTERRVVDYIAGMTDRYALRTAEELALTKTETGKSLY
jgi:dGTPase